MLSYFLLLYNLLIMGVAIHMAILTPPLMTRDVTPLWETRFTRSWFSLRLGIPVLGMILHLPYWLVTDILSGSMVLCLRPSPILMISITITVHMSTLTLRSTRIKWSQLGRAIFLWPWPIPIPISLISTTSIPISPISISVILLYPRPHEIFFVLSPFVWRFPL